MTPLHLASRDNSEEIAQLLLQAGADPEALDSKGNTPAALAPAKQTKKTASTPPDEPAKAASSKVQGASSRSSGSEWRIDPADGTPYTWEQMSGYYKGTYKKGEIKSYWDDCAPAASAK